MEKKWGKQTKEQYGYQRNICQFLIFWQFWRNTVDQDVIKFLKLFTEIDLNEISKLEKLQGEEINE